MVGGVTTFVLFVNILSDVSTRDALALSDYHTLTLSGGGRLHVSTRGVATTRCRGGTTFAGCLPGVTTVKACVHARGRVSLLDSRRGKTVDRVKAATRNSVRRAFRRLTTSGPRLTRVLRPLTPLVPNVKGTLGGMKRNLMSTLHASAHGVCTKTIALARPVFVKKGVITCGGVAGCTRRLTRSRRTANVRSVVLDASRTC